MKRDAFALLLALCCGCRGETPAPPKMRLLQKGDTFSTTVPMSVSSAGVVSIASPAPAEPCPPSDAAEREHCVWLKAIPGVSGADLARRVKAAGFTADADGDRVTAWWTPERIEAFFHAKPGYVSTGGGERGMVCLIVMPPGAKPVVRSAIAGWAIDDPVCEL